MSEILRKEEPRAYTRLFRTDFLGPWHSLFYADNASGDDEVARTLMAAAAAAAAAAPAPTVLDSLYLLGARLLDALPSSMTGRPTFIKEWSGPLQKLVSIVIFATMAVEHEQAVCTFLKGVEAAWFTKKEADPEDFDSDTEDTYLGVHDDVKRARELWEADCMGLGSRNGRKIMSLMKRTFGRHRLLDTDTLEMYSSIMESLLANAKWNQIPGLPPPQMRWV